MGKRDVWVVLGRNKAVRADQVQSMDWSEERALWVKVSGEREPLELRRPRLPEEWTPGDARTRGFLESATPVAMGRGLLNAIADAADQGGHWLLTFAVDEQVGEACWTQTALGGYAGPA
jgi:hypothetical protein